MTASYFYYMTYIGFFYPTGLEILSLSNQWHADGTFRAAPPDVK